jgi:hypothetical protein
VAREKGAAARIKASTLKPGESIRRKQVRLAIGSETEAIILFQVIFIPTQNIRPKKAGGCADKLRYFYTELFREIKQELRRGGPMRAASALAAVCDCRFW